MDRIAVTWIVFVALTGLAATTMVVVTEMRSGDSRPQPRVQLRAAPSAAAAIRDCPSSGVERQDCIDRLSATPFGVAARSGKAGPFDRIRRASR